MSSNLQALPAYLPLALVLNPMRSFLPWLDLPNAGSLTEILNVAPTSECRHWPGPPHLPIPTLTIQELEGKHDPLSTTWASKVVSLPIPTKVYYVLASTRPCRPQPMPGISVFHRHLLSLFNQEVPHRTQWQMFFQVFQWDTLLGPRGGNWIFITRSNNCIGIWATGKGASEANHE